MTTNMDISLIITLLNNMEDSACIMDTNGDTLFANNATIKLYQCTRAVFEKLYKNMYAMEKQGTFKRNIFHEVLKKKEPVGSCLMLTDINKQSKLYYVVASPVFDSDGNVKYVVSITRSHDKIEKEYAAVQNSLDQSIFTGQLSTGDEQTAFIYKSQVMNDLVHSMTNVANTDVPILLQGETGVGKEVVANHFHNQSNRKNRPMVTINCAAISPSLFESEMFGYAKGAFTGSSNTGRIGLIEAANHSTLFLDEIDSMPLEQQGKLLRALETKTIYRVGESKPVTVDFRLIAATNKNIQKSIWEGQFREDLYYRLNVVPAEIPPLRYRKDDIRPLTDYFLKKYCNRYSVEKRFSEHVYEQLKEYEWPGNVRELKNLIERTVLMSDPSVIDIRIINLLHNYKNDFNGSPKKYNSRLDEDDNSLNQKVNMYEKRILQEALQKYGSLSEVAKHLDVSISTLHRKTVKYGIIKKNYGYSDEA